MSSPNRMTTASTGKSSSTVSNISRYSVHPSVAMVAKNIAGLKSKTGRSLDEWMHLIEQDAPAESKTRAQWLKSEHSLGTNYAKWLTELSFGKDAEAGDAEAYLRAADQYVETQYAGAKEHLRPIYEALLSLGFSLADDVRACPCQTMVPLYRKHVFATITPSTLKRVDLGLALRDMKTPNRLIDTGGFEKKDRISRRIPISSVDEIDSTVERWLRTAYEMDA